MTSLLISRRLCRLWKCSDIMKKTTQGVNLFWGRRLSLQKRAASLRWRDTHHAVGHKRQSAGGGDEPLGTPPALGRQRIVAAAALVGALVIQAQILRRTILTIRTHDCSDQTHSRDRRGASNYSRFNCGQHCQCPIRNCHLGKNAGHLILDRAFCGLQ
jgi:hypothetical protein